MQDHSTQAIILEAVIVNPHTPPALAQRAANALADLLGIPEGCKYGCTCDDCVAFVTASAA